MTLCKSRTSNYWDHSGEIYTLVNQDDHVAPIRSPVRGRTGFSKSGGLRASVTFFPLPHPLPSNFLLSPHFSCAPNAKNYFAWPKFRSPRTGMLATQANIPQLKLGDVRDYNPSIFSLALDCSKPVMWVNIPQPKLGNIREYSPIFKSARVAEKI